MVCVKLLKPASPQFQLPLLSEHQWCPNSQNLGVRDYNGQKVPKTAKLSCLECTFLKEYYVFLLGKSLLLFFRVSGV